MASSLLSAGAAAAAAAAARFSPLPLNRRTKRQPPLTISTSPSHVDATVLRDLLHCSGHSCHKFPVIGRDGRPEPVDLGKLRLALEHSAIVVSVFCRSTFLEGDCSGSGFAELFERAVPVPTPDWRLVGFGRAVTDGGLTASIHDVVVVPPLQRLGIGRRIVQKIIRFLTSRGIYDISALCSKEERPFFRACGFGDDSLGSITMMYTRTAPNSAEERSTAARAGRTALLVPKPARNLPSKQKVPVE